MNKLPKNGSSANEKWIVETIKCRRSVRDFTSQEIDKATVNTLLAACVHAPTAMHEEPWMFVVVQNRKILSRLSDTVKELLTHGDDPIHPSGSAPSSGRFTAQDFNAFYNASTLIVICAKPTGPFVVADCWLAAQNLMLAAYAKGLGTCVIGLSVTALNTPEWKKELGISVDVTAFAPIIVGFPAGETSDVPRKAPKILNWM